MVITELGVFELQDNEMVLTEIGIPISHLIYDEGSLPNNFYDISFRSRHLSGRCEGSNWDGLQGVGRPEKDGSALMTLL